MIIWWNLFAIYFIYFKLYLKNNLTLGRGQSIIKDPAESKRYEIIIYQIIFTLLKFCSCIIFLIEDYQTQEFFKNIFSSGVFSSTNKNVNWTWQFKMIRLQVRADFRHLSSLSINWFGGTLHYVQLSYFYRRVCSIVFLPKEETGLTCILKKYTVWFAIKWGKLNEIFTETDILISTKGKKNKKQNRHVETLSFMSEKPSADSV